MKLAIGIGLIALAMLILWAAFTLAIVAESAEADSLTAKILATWAVLPAAAGGVLIAWSTSPGKGT